MGFVSSRFTVRSIAVAAGLLVACAALPAAAQPLLKSAVNVDAGNTKAAGETFTYRLTYNCSSTSGPCLGAEVVDLLPAEVQFVSTVPASPSGDVAGVTVTSNYMGTGRTRVVFDLVDPLPAGNSGDLLVNVRFPNGSTPDGTVATNAADGTNLETVPGTFTTPPVDVTAVAALQVDLSKTLTTSPANLDDSETYRLRISVPNDSGGLDLTTVGPVTDTLPPGTVFNGSTPAADCEPGCVGTTPATLAWSSPCALPVEPGESCDVQVNVTFPSATFTSGASVTNSFVADVTPLGEPPLAVGPGSVTHPVTLFVPNPGLGLSKNVAGGEPNPPTLDQPFSYDLNLSNNGNVDLDGLVLIDDLPVQMAVAGVTSGAWNGTTGNVAVSYETNLSGGFLALGSSPAGTNATFPIPALGAGEHVTRLRWEFPPVTPAFAAAGGGNRPRIIGRIVNPDHLGNPVSFGDPVQNCADASAVYTAGPTNVSRNACRTFNLSGPFVQLNPAKENLSGGGPFAPGQAVSYRLRVRSDGRSSDAVPLEHVVATDLLPVDLLFDAWTFDDRGTGLPAPQTFEEIPNFANTGRTLLRWTWNAGSGDLPVGEQVWITLETTIRNGAAAGSLANDFTLEHDAPGLAQRCTGASQADVLDLDGDADTAETLCRESESVNVAGIAQLVSSKTVRGTCDGGSVAASLGTLTGGAMEYRLRVQNLGTVPMEDFVLVDVLPFVGDTGVRDTNPRGSQWTPLLAAPITPPAGTAVYYSTSGNPCRGEVGGPTTGCDPPGWSTVPPEPITAARSFKVEFGDRVVAPFDFVDFAFLLTTPGDVPPGAEAFNSFAYQAERADGLGALAAEPQKVGISLGACEAASLGDFVWADVDGNGLQDDGPTGLNGVYVRLFDPGPDGLPATADDVPLSAVVTGNGPGGQPGWYGFPGLAPGDYLVCVEPPPTFVVTARDQGGDDALDSDADPATACSPVVVLAADEDDPTVDFGLEPTELAAVGDHVWFDRDGDGVQDESPFDGANGVTVRLFVDDGDGVAEPGADFPAASTVTADDVYGRPGYYLFDGLVPGVDYFLQFVLPPSATGFTAVGAGDASTDSDAAPADGTTAVFSLAPEEVDRTFDAGLVVAAGPLALGDQVWLDGDDDGLFEPQDGEVGIDGVRLDLYVDANGDGEPTLGEHVGSTATATLGGFVGRYHFGGLAAGDYVVVVAPSAFLGGGPLAGFASSSGNDPAPDPDDDANGDDNGTEVGALVATRPVTLAPGGEPTAEDGDDDTNLTVDFGFFGPVLVAPEFDYGDAPDVAAGSGTGDYSTVALDGGAYHRLGVAGAPYLGSCVDADGGFQQDDAAAADDLAGFGTVVGACAGGDDEDGVAFTGPFVPGSTAAFTVTAAAGVVDCALDAWVDWNRNGVLGDGADEVVGVALAIPAGTSTLLNPAVPATAVPGVTYARFRCSSAGGLLPTGGAADGEVEDYRLAVVGTDHGDAPDSYGTTGAGAASHGVDPLDALYLGSCVDLEVDGQPDGAALGDDGTLGTATVGTCFDDEDGVAFGAVAAACQGLPVTVTASAAGLLDAWIDFDGDGGFAGPGEQVFAGQPLAAGANPLSLTVPCTAVEGATYARFRFSSAGGLAADGAAPDGEVEDHALDLRAVDFGDAPDAYGTLFGSGGPLHGVVAGFSLGAGLDAEAEGQPSPDATGDDGAATDDEDGVAFPGGAILTACAPVSLPVELTNAAGVATPLLDAWIDWDGDGSFDDPRDRVAAGMALSPGTNALNVPVPCDAGPAITYLRLRLSSTGVAGPGGPAPDGEVEDHALTVLGLDFGDAPEPAYPTLLASDGARHAVAPLGNPTLGARVDTEGDGQPNASLAGDDAAGAVDDEDGVAFPSVLVPGTSGSIQLTGGPVGGLVSCWIDFDRDGDWTGAGEAVVVDFALGASTLTSRTFPVPAGSPQGSAATRCRIDSGGGLGVTGLAADGEVEDLPAPVGVEAPQIGVAKRVVGFTQDPDDRMRFDVTFEVRLENLGNVPLADVGATADLATAFAAAAAWSVVSVTSADFVVAPGFDGDGQVDLLTPGNGLSVGETGTVVLVVRVDTGGEAGPYYCSSLGRGTSPGDEEVTDVSQDGPEADADGDGSATDDDEPTPVIFPVSILEIPTLEVGGLLLMAFFLAAAALWQARRRRTA